MRFIPVSIFNGEAAGSGQFLLSLKKKSKFRSTRVFLNWLSRAFPEKKKKYAFIHNLDLVGNYFAATSHKAPSVAMGILEEKRIFAGSRSLDKAYHDVLEWVIQRVSMEGYILCFFVHLFL